MIILYYKVIVEGKMLAKSSILTLSMLLGIGATQHVTAQDSKGSKIILDPMLKKPAKGYIVNDSTSLNYIEYEKKNKDSFTGVILQNLDDSNNDGNDTLTWHEALNYVVFLQEQIKENNTNFLSISCLRCNESHPIITVSETRTKPQGSIEVIKDIRCEGSQTACAETIKHWQEFIRETLFMNQPEPSITVPTKPNPSSYRKLKP